MPDHTFSAVHTRRSVLAGFAGLVALGVTACAKPGGSGPAVAAGAPVPDAVPPGTSLSIAVHTTEVVLKTTGTLAQLPFTVSDWPTTTAGPDVIQAFRANALDLATNAGIPPIQARATGQDAKIVAVQLKDKPIYKLATAPGSNIASLADLRGKKIAFSPGQAQGVVVLRTLKELGLKKADVQLIELNSPQFPTALQSKQVDVAVLAEPSLTKYLNQYEKDGARGLPTDAVDALTILWAPSAVLADPAKAAAIKSFIPVWARSQVWAWENQDAWINAYYVQDQEVSAEDGKRIIESNNKPIFPAHWDSAIKWEQETIDLVSGFGYFGKSFNANELFDRRFEGIAAAAVPENYRGGQR